MKVDIFGMEFDLEYPTSIYANCDCMIGMNQFPDKYFDLAVVDPPYGISIEKSGRLRKHNTDNVWDNQVPDK